MDRLVNPALIAEYNARKILNSKLSSYYFENHYHINHVNILRLRNHVHDVRNMSLKTLIELNDCYLKEVAKHESGAK